MKIEEVTSRSTVTEGLVLHNIGLDPSRIGFIQEIMRSKIYTYPVLACVREVLTNALDASKKVGKGASSITVHLPTASEPYFSVKDEGIGMSKEVFLKYFAEYGNSLASGSDEFTGCYGLGSKAPFTITNNFKVSTSWEGERYSYVCFITDEGNNAVIPSSQLKSSKVGTEILIEDIDKHAVDIISSYYNLVYLWDVKPKCNIEVIPKEVLLAGKGWEVVNNSFITHSDKVDSIINVNKNYSLMEFANKLYLNDVIFLMGGVSYNFRKEDIIKLSQKMQGSKFDVGNAIDILINNSYKSKDKRSLIFYCDIGSISISPQREYIDLDKSIDFVKDRFNSLMNEMEEAYKKKVESCNNLIEACNISSTFNHFRGDGVKFKGVSIPYYSLRINKGFEIYKTGISNGKTLRKYQINSIGKVDKTLNIIVDNVNPKSNTISNIGKILKENGFYDCYLIRTGVLSKEDVISAEEYLNPDLYPPGRLLFLSDLVKPKKLKAPSAKVRVSSLLEKEVYDYTKGSDFKDSMKPLDEPNVYFCVSYWRGGYTGLKLEDLKAIQKSFGTNIFGISSNDIDRVKKAGWLSWEEKYSDLLEKNKEKIESAKRRICNYCLSNNLESFRRILERDFEQTVIYSKYLIEGHCLSNDWLTLKTIASRDKSLANSSEYIELEGLVNLLEEVRLEFRSNQLSLFPNIHKLDKESNFLILHHINIKVKELVPNNIEARIILNTNLEDRGFLIDKLFKENNE